jgi:UDP-N-acetylmuramyl pentapeptide phosphotransferase/UDP-N-acetylglucosamine-1-phosphate transferase
MHHLPSAALYSLAAALLAWVFTGVLRRWLTKRARVAEPTDRGMHASPVPVGGGLAIVATIALLWPLAARPMVHAEQVVLTAAIGLCLVSWIDDRRPLWPITRLCVQGIAVAIALSELSDGGLAVRRLVPIVPHLAELILVGFAWVWVINLFNFMDGIDGIAGGETAAIGLGVGAIGLIVATTDVGATNGLQSSILLGLIVAGAALGYLVWNWHPARIFMGDCGAIPLGFLIGWLMLVLSRNGQCAVAIILPLYFYVDATWTLVARLLRGAKPWQAHREHAYQQAVLGGRRPNEVVRQIMAVNVLLIVLAVMSVHAPIPSLIIAAATVLLLMINLKRVPSAATGGTTAGPPPIDVPTSV